MQEKNEQIKLGELTFKEGVTPEEFLKEWNKADSIDPPKEIKLTQMIVAEPTIVTMWGFDTISGKAELIDTTNYGKSEMRVERPYQETSDDCTGNLFKKK